MVAGVGYFGTERLDRKFHGRGGVFLWARRGCFRSARAGSHDAGLEPTGLASAGLTCGLHHLDLGVVDLRQPAGGIARAQKTAGSLRMAEAGESSTGLVAFGPTALEHELLCGPRWRGKLHGEVGPGLSGRKSGISVSGGCGGERSNRIAEPVMATDLLQSLAAAVLAEFLLKFSGHNGQEGAVQEELGIAHQNGIGAEPQTFQSGAVLEVPLAFLRSLHVVPRSADQPSMNS